MPPSIKYFCDHECFTKGLKVKATYGFKTKPPNRCFNCRAVSVMVKNPLIYCKHLRTKSTCKDCGGSQICKHGKQKSRWNKQGSGKD